MSHARFNEIIAAVAATGADVLGIESSRSRIALLDTFVQFLYADGIGSKLHDIHLPRVSLTEEIIDLLHDPLGVLKPEQR